MKRFKVVHVVLTLMALVGAIAYAAPDVEPWRKIYEQRQHAVPQKFDKEVQAAFVDAGVVAAASETISGTLRVEIIDAGTVQVNNRFQCGTTAVCGSIALSSASPSTATVTVPAGSSCACWPVGTTAAIAAGGCAANVSSTTLTLTGPNTVTTTMRYMCFF